MKTVIYFLIIVFCISLLPFDLIKANKIYVLQSNDLTITKDDLNNSARIMITRIADYYNEEATYSIDSVKKQIIVKLDFKSETLMVEKFLLQNGKFDFRERNTDAVLLDNQSIESFSITKDHELEIKFKESYYKLWESVTKSHLNKEIRLFMDGLPIYNPIVKEVISFGSCIISGNMTTEELRFMEIMGNHGELPVSFMLIK